ncbi:MAG: hypothetical protein PVH00_11500 [Gemmatimonadota bacterium]
MAFLLRRAARLLPAGALLLACQSDPTGPLGPGSWGGTGASLSVGPDSTTFEFDCAHGVVRGTIDLDQGRFRQLGEYVVEGGPVPDEPPDAKPAIYAGTVNGSTLLLSVEVDGFTAIVGPYTLRRGSAPLLRKCL